MNDTNQSTNQNQSNNDGGRIFGTTMNFASDAGQVNPQTDPQVSPQITNQNNLDAGEEKEALQSIGITFVDDDASAPTEPNIFSQNSSFKQEPFGAVSANQKAMSEKKPVIEDHLASVSIPPAESLVQQDVVDTQDLEKDFSETFHTENGGVSHLFDTGSQEDPIAIEEKKLKRIHKELKEKAAHKKIVVKERLEKLKQEKESLGKELEDIKEIESIAQKIEDKLKTLETIDTEIDALEDQAKQELI